MDSDTGVNQPSSEVSCPRCGKSVGSQVINCQHCGMNLFLAAVIVAEQSLTDREFTTLSHSQGTAPLTPEVLVPRLGEILLEKGLVQPADLERALSLHQARAADGQPRRLGQILLDLSLIDRETLDKVITEQILTLQSALHLANRRLEQRVQERTADLQDALSKLSELNQLKSNFISNISHELRTPLTHMKGYLDLLADNGLGPITPVQKEAIEVLMRAETRLEGLIDDLILFSLAVRGEFTLHPVPLNINDLINATMMRAQKLAKARKITLETALEEGIPLIMADNEKITWVILQLLDNAIKFTPQGGFVTINARAGDRGVTVSVEDTGIGIPAARFKEIFEPFHQLDSSDTRRYGGTGLGLALVRRILEAHGSLIKVQSEVGRGSRFEFTLPVGKKHYV
jgi:signal transduction histidine kinase